MSRSSVRRTALLLALLPSSVLIAAPLTRADEVAALKTAGLMDTAGRLTTCATGQPGWAKSRLAVLPVDLNKDGIFEAFVTEENAACYGDSGTAFTVVARGAAGRWRRLGSAVGIPAILETGRLGWADIEVGGPGMGRMPVMRWTGSAYAEPR